MDLEALAPHDLLDWATQTYPGRFAIVTSFQAEGMVILDMASRLGRPVRVVTLDTGRLPAETYRMIESVRARYGFEIEAVSPEPGEVTGMTTRFGEDLFLEAKAFRELCCEVRKVRPLAKKLAGFSAYAVGLRRDQSESRQAIKQAALVDGRLKLSPLAAWTRDEVWRYIHENDVPVHPLYAEGYQTIGCGPCTRAVAAGENERSGRWWWEDSEVKECGLHFSPNGRAQRQVDVMLAEVLAR